MNLTDTISSMALRMDSGGVIRVGQTRVSLDTVVIAFKSGATSEEIAMQYPALELADVYAAIGFYLKNQVEIEAYLADNSADAQTARALVQGVFPMTAIRKTLLDRRDAAAGASL